MLNVVSLIAQLYDLHLVIVLAVHQKIISLLLLVVNGLVPVILFLDRKLRISRLHIGKL